MMKDRIRQIRGELSVVAFAESIGVSREAIRRFENGTNNPSARTISDICKTYNVNEHWLRFGEGEMFNDEQPPSLDALSELHNLDDLSRAIIEGYIQMPEGARKNFLDLVHAVAEKVRKAQYRDATSEAVAHRILEEDVFSGMKNAPAADKPQAK